MKAKGKSRLSRGTIIVLIALLAMVLIVVLSSTALAGGTQGKFDASTLGKADLAKLAAALHVGSNFDWKNFKCNIDLKKFDWKHFDLAKFCAWLKSLKFQWWHCKPQPPCPPTTHRPPTTCTTPTTQKAVTTVPATAAAIETGGGGTAGPGMGIWALGILALALAGGLGWTAVRPAVKRK